MNVTPVINFSSTLNPFSGKRVNAFRGNNGLADTVSIRFAGSDDSDVEKPTFSHAMSMYFRNMKMMVHYPSVQSFWPVALLKFLTADPDVHEYLNNQKISAYDIFNGLDVTLPKSISRVAPDEMEQMPNGLYNSLADDLIQFAVQNEEEVITPVTAWRWLMLDDPSGTMGMILEGAGFESSDRPDQDMIGRIRRAPALKRQTMSGTPVRPTKAEILALEEATSILPQKIFGQDKALEQIIDIVETAKLGYPLEPVEDLNPNEPKVKALLLGPSGVGKTESIKQLARALGRDLIVVSMTEYKDKQNVGKLGGAGPGYKGYGDKGSFAYKIIKYNNDVAEGKKKPPIVLLDEIEKAHDDVFDVLMQVLDQGLLESGTGEEAFFKGIDIFATSNIAQREIAEAKERDASDEEIEGIVMGALTEKFRPEFVGRFETNFVIFETLTKEVTGRILDYKLDALKRNVKAIDGYDLVVKPELRDHILEVGYNTERGIRELEGKLKAVLNRKLTRVRKHIIKNDLLETTSKVIASLDDGAAKLRRTSKRPKQVRTEKT